MQIETGATVYVATDLRYVGKFTVETVESAETVIITNGTSRGRASVDQLYPTKSAAQAAVKAISGGSLADIGGNKIARRRGQR